MPNEKASSNKLQPNNDLRNTMKIKKWMVRGEIPYQLRTDRLKTDNSPMQLSQNHSDSSQISMTQHGIEQVDNTVKVNQHFQNIAFSNKFENPKVLKFKKIYKTPLKNLSVIPEHNLQKDFLPILNREASYISKLTTNQLLQINKVNKMKNEKLSCQN